MAMYMGQQSCTRIFFCCPRQGGEGTRQDDEKDQKTHKK
uniref:Uncharacterized protein n=1 Tax=Rhizophora mucronata TaxID=61149 RepID=A0A2P2LCX9_RHIMU